MHMRARQDLNPPPAIVRPADPAELLRCHCTIRLMLGVRFPGQGYQMALPFTKSGKR